MTTALLVQISPEMFIVTVFLMLGGFAAFMFLMWLKGNHMEEEMSIYAEKIGASILPDELPCEEFLKPLASFKLLNKYYRNRSVDRCVVYPSDFGDIVLFFYQYANNPPGTPSGSFRVATILVCKENFGLSSRSVSNSIFGKYYKKIFGIKSADKELESLLAAAAIVVFKSSLTGKRHCELEVSSGGIMLYFKQFIYMPSAMPKLIFDFIDLLQEIEKLANKEIETNRTVV